MTHVGYALAAPAVPLLVAGPRRDSEDPTPLVQLTTRFHVAPLAYLLSLGAAIVYLVATLALRRTSAAAHRVARGLVWLARHPAYDSQP